MLLALLLAGGYFYYRSLASGPAYALLQAKEAAQKHDLEAFEKFVDVESITGNLIDEVLQHPVVTGLMPDLGLAAGSLNFLKPQLVRSARKEVQNYVLTGKINTSPTGPWFPVAAIAGIFISEDSKFEGIDYIRETGREAVVGLKFTQPKYDTTLVLELKMTDKGENWQATSFTNATDLMDQIMRLEKARLQPRP